MAAGHDNLAEFRSKVAAQLEDRESIARAQAERREMLERIAATLPPDASRSDGAA